MSRRSGVRPGGPREVAKIALHSALHRFNLDLVRNPLVVRVTRALGRLDANAVLDVGANIGYYGAGLRSSGFRGRIISCEPLGAAFAQLDRRARSDNGWTALNTAVGAEPGELEINVSANSYSSSALPMNDAHRLAAPGSEYVAVEKAPVTTVTDLVATYQLEPARTLLKVDTQGYEGARLDAAGFGVFAPDAGFSNPRSGRMLQCDGLFVRRDRMPDPSA